ncbi:MAG: 16S rRNA pseudouridylate synthase [Leptothrix sp. (in: Bacteria)]|nr:16S rRNA pseudouridylate synthase [Leptothrix sp. (in: b-proteobacteria)]
MTERKKIILANKPATPDAEHDAFAPRRPPVRGAGSAPRKRMTVEEAEQAAKAREEAAKAAAQAPAAAPRDESRWPGERPRTPAPRRDERDRPAADRPRDDRPRGPVPQRFDDRRPDPRNDQRPPRQDPRSQAPRGPRQDNRPNTPPPPQQDFRKDGRRAQGPRPTPVQQPTDGSVEHDGRIRLSKLMSERGLSSRREADEWIEHGWVLVDGEVVSELGSRVYPHQDITIDVAAKTQQAQRVTILINKPIGYVSGQAEDGYEPAFVLIRPENQWKEGDRTKLSLTRGHLKHLAPAGRLDIDSTGLLVLTQDGRIARELIGEDSNVEKEYLVRVELPENPDEKNISGVFPGELMDKLRHGLMLDGIELKPAKVSWQNEQQLRFVLREGRKRQIRRMCEQVGLKVVGLKRVRMGRIVLGNLPLGQWRFLQPDERF